MHRIAAIAVALLGGCTLYFDQPQSADDVCTTGAPPPPIALRDPQTGVCQPVGTGCPNPCEPCAGGGGAQPNWAVCDGVCEALDETTCFATAHCRAVFRDDHSTSPPQFFGCWGTAPGFVTTGSCTGLDAQSCSEHDTCSAIYIAGANGPDAFGRCIAEPATHDPGECKAATCTMPPPACPTGWTAGVLGGCYTGYCIPTNACGVRDAGTCETAICAAKSPICPAGTIPGTRNGCYTDFCIPVAACP